MSKFITTEDGCHLYVTPSATFPRPRIPGDGEGILGEGLSDKLSRVDSLFINRYFDEVMNGDIRVCIINGVPTHMDFSALFCDYCGGHIGESHKSRDDCYWRCWDCQKDMCDLCHGEVDEAAALSNGAVNYALRRDALALCLDGNISISSRGSSERPSVHKIQRRVNRSFDYRRCDICENIISDDSRWGNKDKDVCKACSLTPDGLDFIENMGLWEFTMKEVWDNTEFGSMMDWVPVYKDSGDGESMILMNCKSDSSLFGRICLSAGDDHGRYGFFTVDSSFKMSDLFEKMEAAYKIKCDELIQDDSQSQIEYVTPIQELMNSLGIPTYYG